jgi:RNA polymerase sigma-70 factor (ECF subfamily)
VKHEGIALHDGGAKARDPAQSPDGVARGISFVGDEEAWVCALAERQPAAIAAFYDCYAERVRRVLVRILGNDQDLADVHHETFVRALGSIASLRDPSRLTAWVTSVAVLSARTCLQRRSRRRWLVLTEPDELAALDARTPSAEPTVREALAVTYRLFDQLPALERIVFALRFIEGMQLAEVADACGISLATTKRRLARAERQFLALARRHPVLSEWVAKGGRWIPTS